MEAEEEVLNFDDEPVVSAKKKREAQPTLAHLFRFKKPAAPENEDEDVGEPKAKKSKGKGKGKEEAKKKESLVIASSDEEQEDAEQAGAKAGKKKASKKKEKVDLSHLRGPVDLAKGTVTGTMRAVSGGERLFFFFCWAGDSS